MLGEKHISHFHGLVRDAVHGRDLVLGRNIVKWETVVGRGHSFLVVKAIECGTSEVHIRAARAAEKMMAVIDSSGLPLDDALCESAAREVAVAIEHQAEVIKTVILGHPSCRQDDLTGQRIHLVDEEARIRSDAFRNAIQLKAMQHANQPPPKKGSTMGSNRITIHRPVNVLQTGDHSSAVGHQQVGGSDAAALVEALRTLLAELRQTADADLGGDKAEVVETVEAAIVEVEKPKPNKLILGSLITGVDKTLTIAGKLGTAYQGVKVAAKPFGIELP